MVDYRADIDVAVFFGLVLLSPAKPREQQILKLIKRPYKRTFVFFSTNLVLSDIMRHNTRREQLVHHSEILKTGK